MTGERGAARIYRPVVKVYETGNLERTKGG